MLQITTAQTVQNFKFHVVVMMRRTVTLVPLKSTVLVMAKSMPVLMDLHVHWIQDIQPNCVKTETTVLVVKHYHVMLLTINQVQVNPIVYHAHLVETVLVLVFLTQNHVRKVNIALMVLSHHVHEVFTDQWAPQLVS